MSGFAEALARLQAAMPDLEAAEVFVSDLNGVPRGKLIPASKLKGLAKGGVKMPVSSLGLDIFGADVPESGTAIERGDPDGLLLPVPESLAPMGWAARPTAQLICTLTEEDGSPCAYDPRSVLAGVVAEAAARGIIATMAFELEFYLVDPARPTPPPGPDGEPLSRTRAQIYDLERLRAFEPVMARITEAARAAGAPVETAIAEFGPGQFEVNLVHVADPLAAADHLVILKRAVRGVARAAGLDASFMPKPYGEQAGSGLHVHLSLKGPDGALFDAGDGPAPAPRAGHALAGLIAHMADAMLIFAPHANSYRRLMPGSYAPRAAAWGLDNRGAALRMPETAGPGARIEHRVSGADANPYLVAAAVLAGALAGLEAGLAPPPPVPAEADLGDGLPLPLTWIEAERALAESPFVARWLGAEFARIFAAIKRQERATLLARVPDTEYDAYLRTV
ncbi:glutamine synthetase family protein [Paralimibaculum aggregatum]|uniref:Glutamine synthetase family protein n=1 Tax=Paralimibaculum aggregatum TaxID=3036245 RepID=A0ABQ6LJR3_9RHOB|nr:glutamine synthetase family protein [Limibaculum sp. NKW23]GMG83494.1 glutamine synthetase family protein [Limibaculum sp. NKW23]